MIRRSLVGKVKHIWSKDPALDLGHPNFSLAQYRETGDAKYMPALEGQKLTEFEISGLRRRVYIRVMSNETIERAQDAIAYGLKSVSNFIGTGGEPVELKFQDVDGFSRLTPDSLDEIFDPDLFVELGVRIIELSKLSPLK